MLEGGDKKTYMSCVKEHMYEREANEKMTADRGKRKSKNRCAVLCENMKRSSYYNII